MENGDGIILGIVALIIFLTGVFVCSSCNEGLTITTLDNICQELTNNTEAYFVKEFGVQDELPCRIEDQIFIFGRHDQELNITEK